MCLVFAADNGSVGTGGQQCHPDASAGSMSGCVGAGLRPRLSKHLPPSEPDVPERNAGM